MNQPWNALTLQLSLCYVTIRLCLLAMFISSEATVVAVKTAQAFLSRVNNEFIYGNLISFIAPIFHS